VVVVTHGRDDHLHRQRAGLALGPSDVHVVVGMGEQPRLAQIPGAPPVTRVHVPVPATGLPLAAARNAGAAAAIAAGAELLVLLDVDCIPGPNLVRRYAGAAGDELALLCGPVAYLPPPPPGGYPATGLGGLADPHPARPAPPDGQLERTGDFTLFWSLSFAVTAATWTRLGGFCEDYTGYGGEDTDFAVTAEAAGAQLVWVGGAEAHHQHHPPARTDPRRVGEIVRNATLFHRRHGWWPMGGWLTELAAAGAVEFDPSRDVLRMVGEAGTTRPCGVSYLRRAGGDVRVAAGGERTGFRSTAELPTRRPAKRRYGEAVGPHVPGYPHPVNHSEWTTTVALELGLETAAEDDSSATTISELTSRVTDGVDAGAAPMTAFLIGVAAGRADDPAVAARDYTEKIAHLADGWGADEERGVPANDQSARA